MLDADTRRRIDNARDILVGKVPDPKSQVEQITIALIYKFMNDIDRQSEELGGVPTFFSGDFEQYRWTNLVHGALSGNEMLKLYTDALDRMPQNQNIPLFFRSIFDNAYLPYNSPETLRLFLRAIDKFSYDNSEHLGDAYEYLLSVLGSQGDAGQFRTPRHIIDFIVSIVDPQKRETILDPACGTAGFLISAYKHIQNANTNGQGASTLTSDEKDHLANSILGYDISPEMTRLSRVNMYLHGLADPRVHEYDTLTSEDRWNERADIILANPPFMSPRGGITPHKRFSIASNRSEALFVDYIASHLTPTGRAGVIVPEGIIFQTQTAYVRLRRMLIERYLAAVVSLPSGVFNPYSGVKTSILILDPALARSSDRIAFLKVDADGFNLGAQRRPIPNNDLPTVRDELAEFLQRARASENLNDYAPTRGFAVERSRILNHQDCTLSPEPYRPKKVRDSKFPYVELGEIAAVVTGNSAPQEAWCFDGGTSPFVRTSDVGAVHRSDDFKGSADKVNALAIEEKRLRLFPQGTILFPKSGASTYLNHRVVLGEPAYVSSTLACIVCDANKALPRFVYRLLCDVDARELTHERDYPSLRLGDIKGIQIPLPPLDLQREIVAEIDAYQRVIDGARLVLQSYRPHIPIDPSWPLVQLGEVCSLQSGSRQKGGAVTSGIPSIGGEQIDEDGNIRFNKMRYITEEHYAGMLKGRLQPYDALLVKDGATTGKSGYFTSEMRAAVNEHVFIVRAAHDRVLPRMLYLTLRSKSFQQQLDTFVRGIIGGIGLEIARIEIPLPPFHVQESIVEAVEAEQALVDANRDLVSRMEARIAATISRVWSTGSS